MSTWGRDGTTARHTQKRPPYRHERTRLHRLSRRHDTIIGGAGDDKLKGGHGDDTIDGGDGDDWIDGGPGDDTIDGGSGNDYIKAGSGDDTVTDFTAGAGTDDRLDVFEFGFTDLADLLGAADDGNGANPDTVISLDADDSVTLIGVQKADLHDDDFLF